MEVKTAAWSTVALVIVAFGAVVIYSIEREGIKSDLSKAQKELEGQETVLDAQKRSLASRNADFESLKGRVARMDALGKEIESQQEKNEATTRKINDLRAAWAEVRKAFSRDIDVVRGKAKDDIMPELKLVDGKSLKSVHFKEIKDNVVILEHSEGIARVAIANMNKDWMGRLALGWNPKLSAELSGVPDAPEVEAEKEVPVATVAEVRQAHVESVKRADVSQLEDKIKVLNRQIAEAQAAVSRHNKAAEEYANKYAQAQWKGNSSNYKVKRDAALKTAQMLSEQITAAQNQISALQQRIEDKSN